eukprot:snap_masked-scaffold_47-processed-gene-1.41-mRNA-1 protein AED:1.00 eAED:1.00 QI:0/0/0/0/1/1/3/0/67
MTYVQPEKTVMIHTCNRVSYNSLVMISESSFKLLYIPLIIDSIIIISKRERKQIEQEIFCHLSGLYA